MLKSVLVLTMLCSSMVSCTYRSVYETGELDNKAQAVEIVERLVVKDATAQECPAGGKVYIVYADAKESGPRKWHIDKEDWQMIKIGVYINDVDEVPLSSQIVCSGQDGAAGSNGHSMQFSILTAAPQLCPTGGSTILMALDINDNGFYSATDPNQQMMTICNGVNGTNGTNGVDAPVAQFSPVEAIIPCGNTASYKEILLRLQNGQVLASFSDNANGLNTRLTLIPDGTFMTSDGTNCVFSLATSVNGLQRSISWSNQVQISWPLL